MTELKDMHSVRKENNQKRKQVKQFYNLCATALNPPTEHEQKNI